MTKVTFKNSGGTATKIVEYTYDHGQRWVRKTLDTNADGTIESSQVFVHDNGQIVLDFQKTGTVAASNSDLANRYLWGTNVDELLTDEAVDDGSEDDTRWAATDHLNSVRDLLVYDPVTGTVSVIKHVTFDAFGQETSNSAPTIITLHGFTARPYDPDTGNNNNGFRWYDLSTGRWMSVDPIGFEAGDVNLYRYVGNGVVCVVDPTGQAPPDDGIWPVGPKPPWYQPPKVPRCTQAQINRDNLGYLNCIDCVDQIYNNPKSGVYAQLEAARKAKIAWWDAQLPLLIQGCINRLNPRTGRGMANCRQFHSMIVATMKKNVNIAYWTAAHVADSMERIEVEACSEKNPCNGKKPGDPVSELGSILERGVY